MTDVLEILNYIFTAIFALEMLIKLVALGLYGYIKDAFNLFDGTIVIIRYKLLRKRREISRLNDDDTLERNSGKRSL